MKPHASSASSYVADTERERDMKKLIILSAMFLAQMSIPNRAADANIGN